MVYDAGTDQARTPGTSPRLTSVTEGRSGSTLA
jgi:hypothetical protein